MMLGKVNVLRRSLNLSAIRKQNTYDPRASSSVSLLGSVRYMGRRDGQSSFFKPRKPSRKKMKQRMKNLRRNSWEKEGKHSAPGSKMVLRKKFNEERLDAVLDRARGIGNRFLPNDYDPEYNEADAMLDDLVGNTKHLTATPTPRPSRMGRFYDENFRKVKAMVDKFHASQCLVTDGENNNENNFGESLMPTPLPNDHAISLLVRSFRDKFGGRSKPVGIEKVLDLLINEIGIPSSTFKERTYSAIMSCSAHPFEAKRIMQLMKENEQPLSSCIYSVLVDIYAKVGDFRRARETIEEMSEKNLSPTLPAYTSLLAACHQVLKRGNAPHKLKAEAANVAWESWKEMRIVGLRADVMAYGAIIQVCSSQGKPEKCLNLIEEMDSFQIKPTTLIFTSALRGVAKSHEIALRFEGGYSTKNRRREKIASYHGKLAREIVIKAENAEVNHDKGFIAALILCAAASGDSATAKAIYLASTIRNMSFLRSTGSDEHLQNLLTLSSSSSTNQSESLEYLASSSEHSQKDETRRHGSLDHVVKNEGFYVSDNHRKDSRIYSALLLSYANSMKKKGLGLMWAGVEKKGFLCETTLNEITKTRVPRYHDNSIPGMTGMEVALGATKFPEEDPDRIGKRLKLEKYKGLEPDLDAGFTLDDIDEDIYKMFDETPDDVDPEIDEDYSQNREVFYEVKKEDTDVYNLQGSEYFDNEYTMKKGGTTFTSQLKTPINNIAVNFDESTIESMGNSTTIEKMENLIYSSSVSMKPSNSDFIAGTNVETVNDKETLKGSQSQHRLPPTLQNTRNVKEETLSLKMSGLEEVSNDNELLEEHINENAVKPDGVQPRDELDLFLDGMPRRRIQMVRKAFDECLGTPSLLRLIPLVRENIPTNVDLKWLRDKNSRNALIVQNHAASEGHIDIHILNGLLQVLTMKGDVDKTLSFYNVEFRNHSVKPNLFSNRLVIGMLIEKRKLNEAISFKKTIESDGNILDILSYGLLIENYANHEQREDAFALLKECIETHGYPPGDKNLKKLRLLCREQDEYNRELILLIGKDPLDWLRHGEKNLKREFSKKGNSFTVEARNLQTSL